jgi:hypothetical protein
MKSLPFPSLACTNTTSVQSVSIEMLASRMETVSTKAYFPKAVRSAVFQVLKHNNSYARDSIHWSMQLLTSEP